MAANPSPFFRIGNSDVKDILDRALKDFHNDKGVVESVMGEVTCKAQNYIGNNDETLGKVQFVLSSKGLGG